MIMHRMLAHFSFVISYFGLSIDTVNTPLHYSGTCYLLSIFKSLL